MTPYVILIALMIGLPASEPKNITALQHMAGYEHVQDIKGGRS